MARIARSSAIVAVGVMLAAGILFLTVMVGFLAEARQDDQQKLREQQLGGVTRDARIAELEAALGLVQDQVEERGEVPVVSTPPEEVGPTVPDDVDDGPVVIAGPPGPPGPPGVGRRGLSGDPGVPGLPGRPPTAAEIAAAVAGYCDANNDCRGARGPAGESVVGPVGPAGESIVGPSGPGPTVEQIAAAVAAYCSTGVCIGPSGPPGAAGNDGVTPTPAEVASIVQRVVASLTFSCQPVGEGMLTCVTR